jgi:hypothetical protein
VNDEAVKGKLLLVPVYQASDTLLYRNKQLAKFQLTPENLALLQRYFEYVQDDRVMLAMYDNFLPDQIAALRTSLRTAQDTFRTDGRPYKNLDVLTRQALIYFSIHAKEFNGFKELDDEINHFRHINQWC